MAYVMRVLGFANGTTCPIAGQFLESMDFEAHDGKGFGTFTLDRTKARRFATPREAFEFWHTVSKTRPRRPDGKPNRPFTCTHVEILEESLCLTE